MEADTDFHGYTLGWNLEFGWGEGGMKSNRVCARLGKPTWTVRLNQGEHINPGCCLGGQCRARAQWLMRQRRSSTDIHWAEIWSVVEEREEWRATGSVPHWGSPQEQIAWTRESTSTLDAVGETSAGLIRTPDHRCQWGGLCTPRSLQWWILFLPGVGGDFESPSHMNWCILALGTWGGAQAQYKRIWRMLQRHCWGPCPVLGVVGRWWLGGRDGGEGRERKGGPACGASLFPNLN